MNIGDYKFNVGDEVVSIWGERGKITHICDCDKCRERGFFEPFWRSDEDENYISEWEAAHGFPSYYKIGKYYFNKLDKEYIIQAINYQEERLEQYRKRLRVIEELEALEGNKED